MIVCFIKLCAILMVHGSNCAVLGISETITGAEYAPVTLLDILSETRRYQKPSMTKSEPMQPGHTLIRPGRIILKSELKFPKKHYSEDTGSGANMDPIHNPLDGGLIINTDFRRQGNQDSNGNGIDASGKSDGPDFEQIKKDIVGRQKEANEIVQNKLWNLKMIGDHVNVKPWQPDWTNAKSDNKDGSDGTRGWWYFLQDDYASRRTGGGNMRSKNIICSLACRQNIISAVKHIIDRKVMKIIIFILQETPEIVNKELNTLQWFCEK